TSIFVTHDQEEAIEVADRIVLMNRGQVEQVGTPEEVYNHPATPFVYSFLGSVNLFHGRVEGEHLQVNGGETVHHKHPEFNAGAEVYAFARPHELEISTDPEGSTGVLAEVDRVLSFGNSARVELEGVNGASGQHFEVTLSKDQAMTLNLQR